MSPDFSQYRKQFPILSSKTYLASHSLGAAPRSTAEALQEYYETWASEGILAWDEPWWNAVLNFNTQIESIINAPAQTVVPMENVTRGFAAIASCLDFSGKRNEIVTTNLEFTTSFPFWSGLQKYGAKIIVVSSEDGISIPTKKITEAINDRTLLVASSHVYFRSGAIQDLKSITEAAHKNGAYCLGDGYQAVGIAPVDVQDLDIDFYVGGSHKWLCGGPGAGFLYVKKELITKLTPAFRGWFGLKNPFSYEPQKSAEGKVPELSDGIYRFLAGTPSVPALYAAREGLKIIQEILKEHKIIGLRKHVQSLSEEAVKEANKRGYQLRSPENFSDRTGMLCMEFSGSKEKVAQLNAQGIIVDWRPDCGMRLSCHFYNDESDLENLFKAI